MLFGVFWCMFVEHFIFLVLIFFQFGFHFCRIYIDAFKKRIESMVERNSSRHTPDWTTAAIHDMAFYPLCK